ncbi:MAG: 4'-phosphopantetheinyl transferase superfamily protein [Gemmatimonadota bacterium]
MSSIVVGNDVVDLAQPRTQGRSSDERFIARVLAPAEAGAVRRSADPDLELWCRWAAKEAGYKVVSKLIGAPPPFVHRAFEPVWEAGVGVADASAGHVVVRRGVVRYAERAVPVTVERAGSTLHAVAHAAREGRPVRVSVVPRVASLDETGAVWAASREELTSRLTPREADAVYSLASAAVRVGARGELAALMGVDEARVEIVCAPGPASQRPPRVLLDGRDAEADVSLSHDGRWIAWALWAPSIPETLS